MCSNLLPDSLEALGVLASSLLGDSVPVLPIKEHLRPFLASSRSGSPLEEPSKVSVSAGRETNRADSKHLLRLGVFDVDVLGERPRRESAAEPDSAEPDSVALELQALEEIPVRLEVVAADLDSAAHVVVRPAESAVRRHEAELLRDVDETCLRIRERTALGEGLDALFNVSNLFCGGDAGVVADRAADLDGFDEAHLGCCRLLDFFLLLLGNLFRCFLLAHCLVFGVGEWFGNNY